MGTTVKLLRESFLSALFVLATLLAAGCKGSGVRAGAEGYPPAEYMTATGLGEDEETAVREARAELSRQISVRIRDEFSTTEESLRLIRNQTARDEYARFVRRETAAITDNELTATKVAAAWYDRRQRVHRALVVLDRQVAGSRYATQVDSAVKQGRLLFGRARARLAEGRYAVALQNNVEALLHIQQAIKLQLAGMVVSPGAAARLRAMVDPDLVSDIKDNLRGQLGDIQLESASGDHQRVYPGGGLGAPVIVRALAGPAREPVAGLPVLFSVDTPAGKRAHRAITDAEGKAKWHIERIAEGEAINTIVATVDIERMGEGGELPGITPPSQTFAFYLPQKSNVLLAVHIESAAASEAMKEALTGDGFQLVEQAKVADLAAKHGAGGEAPEADLLRVFSRDALGVGQSRFLFIVAGWVKPGPATTMETDQGPLHVVAASYSFKLVDANSPGEKKAILVATGQATEGHPGDEAVAAQRAEAAAARKACGTLLQTLNDKLKLEER